MIILILINLDLIIIILLILILTNKVLILLLLGRCCLSLWSILSERGLLLIITMITMIVVIVVIVFIVRISSLGTRFIGGGFCRGRGFIVLRLFVRIIEVVVNFLGRVFGWKGILGWFLICRFLGGLLFCTGWRRRGRNLCF